MTRTLSILAVAAALAVGACGGSPAASSTTSTTLDPDQAMLAFARCMRSHGVDMPDPETDGQGRGRITVNGKPGDDAKLEAAQKACGKYMEAAGPGSLDPEQRQALQDAMLLFAKCMRSHGIDMPDPSPNGGITFKRGAGQRPPEDDPTFDAAEKECREKYLAPAEQKAGIDGPTRSKSGGPVRGTSSGGKA